MPRYVLLRHECPPDYEKPSHWDFMLENDSALLTWELRELPNLWGQLLEIPSGDSNTVTAIPLPDHRPAYLDYQGPISANRGHVTRCDRGNCQVVIQNKTQLEFNLLNGKLTGAVKLLQQNNTWQLTVSDESLPDV